MGAAGATADERSGEAPPAPPADRFFALSREARELTALQSVRVVAGGAAARRELRRGTPLLVRGACRHWPACAKWADDEYLARAGGDAPVTVDWTPDGRADAVVDSEGAKRFAQPLQQTSTMRAFLHDLGRTRVLRGANVPYLSSQCGNLDTELGALTCDIDEPEWAAAVLGSAPGQPLPRPDARNIWIGDARSVTSFHSDPYENIYAVVTGSKVFHLLPPTDRHRLHYTSCVSARWTMADANADPANAELALVDESPRAELRWAQADVKEAARGLWPRLSTPEASGGAPKPLVVTVCAGDALYLPAQWYHSVYQDEGGEGRVTAVNFWYDMQWGVQQAMGRFVDEAWDAHVAGMIEKKC